MTDSLSIPPVATSSPTAPEATSQASQAASTSTAATGKIVLPDLPALPNPSMHLDPQLGVVVLQFHNSAGQVTNTLPTQAQLDAYRAFGMPQPGDGKPKQLA